MISGSSIDWRTDPHAVKKYQFLFHFLPHPIEHRRASLLQNKSIFIYCLLILVITLTLRVVPLLLPGVLGYASNINVADLLKDTNEKRLENGLNALTINDKLSRAAKKKAEYMFAHNYWAHVAPDGTEPWAFILNEGYDYVYAGENLAKNFSNSSDVVNAWMNSPSHRENLLNKNYQDMGLAVVNGVLNGYQTTLVVQMFGKLRTAPAVAPVVTTNVQAEVPAASNVKNTTSEAIEQPLVYEEVQVAPKIDVRSASKTLSLIFCGFMVVLLLLDVWYSKKMGIVKVNGHTLAHITFLLVVMVSIWFVLRPGAVL